MSARRERPDPISLAQIRRDVGGDGAELVLGQWQLAKRRPGFGRFPAWADGAVRAVQNPTDPKLPDARRDAVGLAAPFADSSDARHLEVHVRHSRIAGGDGVSVNTERFIDCGI